MNVPLYLALVLLTWRLSPDWLKVIICYIILIAYVVIAGLGFINGSKFGMSTNIYLMQSHPCRASYNLNKSRF
jgi:NNP family nitrate/nitrite transporter-like MFS transporter